MSPTLGGLSETKPPTPEVQEIVDKLSCSLSKDKVSVCKGSSLEACAKAGRPGGDFEPVFKLKKLVRKMGIPLIASQYFSAFCIGSVPVKLQFESRVNKTCEIFKAISYRTQVVAGTNYFIKVQDSDDNYVHLRVFQGLPAENDCPSLVSFQTGKTRDDPLTYF